MSDRSARNQPILAEFRANAGKVRGQMPCAFAAEHDWCDKRTSARQCRNQVSSGRIKNRCTASGS
jgi:hypothetical protein